MKIISKKTVQVTKRIRLSVSHNNKIFNLYVETRGGKIKGNYKDSVSTSYLMYFHEVPERIRQKHFLQIKKLIEK